MRLHLLFVCCEMHSSVGKQPETRGEVSFPKPSKSVIVVDQKKTLAETSFTVKSSNLAFDFYHL